MNHDRRTRTSLLAAVAISLALAVSSTNAQQALSDADRDFITTAAEGGHAEVSLGNKAAESQNPAIRDFGKQMVEEHTQMNDELATIAKQKGVALPSSADLASQAKGATMSVLPGSTFDSQYVSSQLDDHQETLQLLQTQAQSGRDADLKAFAEKYIPVVQRHIGELQELQKRPEFQ